MPQPKTHGMTGTPEYRAYDRAKRRCNSPKFPHYEIYGGRGIELRCTFEEFYEALGPRPGPEYSVERIDVNGHYEPGNIKWATLIEQARNKRNNRRLTLGGVTKTTVEWAEEVGLKRDTICTRLKRGWCDTCAVLTPVEGKRGRADKSCCKNKPVQSGKER